MQTDLLHSQQLERLESERDLKTYLENRGYTVTEKPGNIYKVTGKNGSQFKAKNHAANRITSELNYLPLVRVAWNLQGTDGYYNFYVK